MEERKTARPHPPQEETGSDSSTFGTSCVTFNFLNGSFNNHICDELRLYRVGRSLQDVFRSTPGLTMSVFINAQQIPTTHTGENDSAMLTYARVNWYSITFCTVWVYKAGNVYYFLACPPNLPARKCSIKQRRGAPNIAKSPNESPQDTHLITVKRWTTDLTLPSWLWPTQGDLPAPLLFGTTLQGCWHISIRGYKTKWILHPKL